MKSVTYATQNAYRTLSMKTISIMDTKVENNFII